MLEGYGLHQKSLVLLALLDRVDTPQQLAHLLRSPTSTVSHLLKEVDDKGLIARTVDKDDKRRFRLTRTASGDDALQAGIAAINRAVRERIEQFAPMEQEVLQKALPLLTAMVAETKPCAPVE